MDRVEPLKFENFLADSFKDGNMLRELRLSNKEIEYIKDKYPQAVIKRIMTDDNKDGRIWYELSFSR